MESCEKQTDNTIGFDKILSCEAGEAQLDYGFVFGPNRQNIFLIKTGQGGSIYGYENKYLKLAINLRDLYGFSVVCAATKTCTINQMEQLFQVLKQEFKIDKETTIYFMGMSKGAALGCLESALFPQISRFLLINPPLMFNNMVEIFQAAKQFSGAMMHFVFGGLDPSVHSAHLLQKLCKKENVRVTVVPEQDHNFSKNNFDLLELARLLV